MDEIARDNKGRWEELAKGNVEFSRPYLDLDSQKARACVDPHGRIGDVEGKDVLCLASGGGQQSAVFGVLGANVTVLDLSETQLQRDRQAAVDDAGWNGIGYPLRDPYVDGAEITDPSPYWDIESADGTPVKVRGPREFRHTLSTLMNGLIAQGFVILRVTETTNDGEPLPMTSELEPGTWDHFQSVAALGLHFRASYRPYVFA